MSKKRNYLRVVGMPALAVVMALGAVGCGGKDYTYDPNTRPLVMSISTPDGVFNPFFSTSAYDSEIVGMTQVSMLGTDKEGKIVWGDDEPVVVKDYKSTYSASADQTTYEFILKNGVKFSDGKPLTMKDVLFNLYTYLDPAYTGSSTIYSTKIVGLEAYRMQNPQATENGMQNFEEGFYDDANMRMQLAIDYVKTLDRAVSSDDKPAAPQGGWTPAIIAGVERDYETTAKEFKKELETDWNTSIESKESYVDWGFTETWQIFLLNDGGFTELLAADATGKYIKDEEGNYQLNEEESEAYELDLEDYMTENNLTDKEAAAKEWAIGMVYETYFPGEIESTSSALFEQVLSYWVTADTIREQFAAEAKSDYFSQTTANGLIVEKIEGIDGTGTTTKDFSGNDLGEPHEVLKITINGVDPKAVWNFAFTVAPLHYYSSENYEGKDYVNTVSQETGKCQFGVKFGDLDFMNEVINAPEKVGLPVGGGVYKASNDKGTTAQSGDEFFNNNVIYYERNEYFETLGSGEEDAKIQNAKIKYVKYKVVETDQIINALANGDIDYGDPSATQENITALDNKGVAHKEVYTSGYGYVGINPRFIPDVSVRRAIMKAMNTSIITSNYYKGGLADLIWRPMSTTSWAYPKGVTVYKNAELGLDYTYDPTGYEIEEMLEEDGYTKNAQGIYEKANLGGFGAVTCDYTFTIAGSTNDHPAYVMFNEAAKILNAHGFKIKVVTSQTALSDLTTGKLEVWAAAWSSTIDPDMYQIYHKDSKATSVNNWGYKQIKAKKESDAYKDEWAIINDLSLLIDQGRETLDEDERTAIYALALDKVMELAVELPTYQRKDMSAFNEDLLDLESLTPDADLTPYNGLLARLWEVDYN